MYQHYLAYRIIFKQNVIISLYNLSFYTSSSFPFLPLSLYIYIYIYVCVCVCAYIWKWVFKNLYSLMKKSII